MLEIMFCLVLGEAKYCGQPQSFVMLQQTNLPFGHVATKVTLPVGAQVTLAVDDRDAFLLWGHHH